MYTVQPSTKVVSAFREMYKRQVLALPVVESGKVVGSLSSSDCRVLNSDNIGDVVLSISEFEEKYELSRDPVTVTSQSTICEACQRMIDSAVHRVWVVDDSEKLVGVVTMSDIIRLYQE